MFDPPAYIPTYSVLRDGVELVTGLESQTYTDAGVTVSVEVVSLGFDPESAAILQQGQHAGAQDLITCFAGYIMLTNLISKK